MPKLFESQNFDKITSPVEFYIQLTAEERGGSVYSRLKSENTSFTFGTKWALLGSINKYQGWDDRTKTRCYSTAFRSKKNPVELWVVDGTNKERVYTGPQDDTFAKEVSYYKARYTVFVFLVSEKGKLCRLELSGRNVGQYFDFVRENPDCEYIEIAEQVEVPNDYKGAKTKTLFLAHFKPTETVIPVDDGLLNSLRNYVETILTFARTGSWDGLKDQSHEEVEPENIPPATIPAPVSTQTSPEMNDDDLPF